MKDNLQKYFDRARAQQPVMDTSELEQLLHGRSVVGKKKQIFNIKLFIIMITIGACTLTFWLMINNTDRTPKTQTESNILPLKEQVTYREEMMVQKVIASTHKPSRKFAIADAPAPATVNEQFGLPFGQIQSNNLHETEEQTVPDESYINEDGYLVLNHDELSGLGIKTDGNVLRYGNVTGTESSAPGCEPCKGTYPFYTLFVDKHGSRRVTVASTKDSAFIHGSTSFWPSYIGFKEQNELQMNLVEMMKHKGYEKNFAASVKQMLVPVMVKLKAKPGKWSHNLDLVFWFKRESAFYDAISHEARLVALNRFGLADMQAYADSLEKYSSLYTENSMKSFDVHTLKSISNNVVDLPEEQLRQLGVTRKKDGFNYSAFLNTGGRPEHVYIKQKGSYTSINTNKAIIRLRAYSKYTPVALTSEDLLHITTLKFYPDTVTGRYELAETYFREHALELVPVRVAPGTLLFFEKDSTLLGLTGAPSRFHTQELARLKKGYLHLNEYQFGKLDAFVPLAISDVNIGRINYVSNNQQTLIVNDDAFIAHVNELLAVQVNGSESVLWYEVTEAMNETLALLHGQQQPDISGIKKLMLDAEQRKKLGITQDVKGTSIPTLVTPKITAYGIYSRSGSEHSFTFKQKNDSAPVPPDFSSRFDIPIPPETVDRVPMPPQPVLPPAEILDELPEPPVPVFPTPYLITNSSGQVWYMFASGDDVQLPDEKISNEAYMEKRNDAMRSKLASELGSFIPVNIPVDSEFLKTNKHIGLIAWYKPDSVFLNALPAQIAAEIKVEQEALALNKPLATCKYFDACSNNAGAITRLNLYPNPVNENFRVDLTLEESRNLNISILDVNGKLVKKLTENKPQEKGTISYPYSPGNLAEGMYLLLITTDKGERMIQRLVKKQ